MQLSTTWFTEPVFDFEYKKYQLLAYLQSKQEELEAQRIYPHLIELDQHLQALNAFLNSKIHFDEKLKKELKGLDPVKLELIYKMQEGQFSGIHELLDIVSYSHKKITSCYHDFHEEAEELRRKIELRIDGLLPGYLKEGFLLIQQSKSHHLFSYSLNPIIDADGYAGVSYQFIETFPRDGNLYNSSLRMQIYNRFKKEFDHPAVFTVITQSDLPLFETILPLSEKELLKWVA